MHGFLQDIEFFVNFFQFEDTSGDKMIFFRFFEIVVFYLEVHGASRAIEKLHEDFDSLLKTTVEEAYQNIDEINYVSARTQTNDFLE